MGMESLFIKVIMEIVELLEEIIKRKGRVNSRPLYRENYVRNLRG